VNGAAMRDFGIHADFRRQALISFLSGMAVLFQVGCQYISLLFAPNNPTDPHTSSLFDETFTQTLCLRVKAGMNKTLPHAVRACAAC
jgi:hypothetical protein